jgi:hypothetical protein
MEPADRTGAARRGEAEVPPGFVSEVDYFLTLLAERDTRFNGEIQAIGVLLTTTNDASNAVITSVKDTADRRFDEIILRFEQRLSEMDLRYQQRFDEQQRSLTDAAVAADRAVSAALESAEKAVSKAEAANEKRFDSVNEFRGQLRDQATSFIPRIEAEQRLSQLAERLDELRNSDALRTGRSAGSSALYGWIIGGIAALATIIVIATTLIK